MLDAILFYLPFAAFRRRARLVLRQALGDEVRGVVWKQFRVHRRELKKTRPKHSPGVNLLIRYMEMDVALYRALMAAEVTKAQAGELIQQINWQLFSPMTVIVYKASRLRSRQILVRCRWMLDAMFAVLFTSPFKRTRLPASNHIGFDVTLCPLADYFRSQGAPELTRYAACSLDHEMARYWGLELKRTGTLADGAPLCDFRFYVNGDNVVQQERQTRV